MRDLVVYFLQLVLRVSLELPPNTINEWLGFPQVLLQESLELCPGNRGKFLTSIAIFVLCPVHTNIPTKKGSCKGGPIEPSSPDGLEIIFASLTEVIAIYMGLTIIYLRYLSLKSSFALRLFRSLVRLQVGLHEIFEQFIGSDKNGSRSGTRSGN